MSEENSVMLELLKVAYMQNIAQHGIPNNAKVRQDILKDLYFDVAFQKFDLKETRDGKSTHKRTFLVKSPHFYQNDKNLSNADFNGKSPA